MNTQAVIRKNLQKQLYARKKSGIQLTKLQASVLNKTVKLTAKELNQAAEQIEHEEGADPMQQIIEKRKEQIRMEIQQQLKQEAADDLNKSNALYTTSPELVSASVEIKKHQKIKHKFLKWG